MINFFRLDNQSRLVDLPGYGYAKVPDSERQRWAELIETYLNTRPVLTGLVIVMDIRHPMSDYDWLMLDWCQAAQVPAHLLLNKADKLKRGATAKTLLSVKNTLRAQGIAASVQTFSASKREGLQALYNKLNQWLIEDATTPDST